MLKIKAAITSSLFIIYTFLSCISGTIILIPGYRPVEDFMLRLWGKISLFILGIKLEVQGYENVPNQGCLFLFNHTSFLDVITITSLIETRLRFGAKEELFSVPLLGMFLRAGRYLKIARGRREEVVKVYKEAERRFQDGESFILAPEGSRQEKEGIAEFKSGPFIFAIEAGVPVVPIIIQGAKELMPKNSHLINAKAWQSKIKIRILPKIETSDYSYESRKELSDVVRGQMIEALKELQDEARAEG